MVKITWIMKVLDPHLQIRGWAGHPDPEMREGWGTRSQKNVFSTLQASQFGPKIRGAPGPSPRSATAWG